MVNESFIRAECEYLDPCNEDRPKRGVYKCSDCGEIIEGDEVYYEVNGMRYCEFCMDYHHKHYAPFPEEVED